MNEMKERFDAELRSRLLGRRYWFAFAPPALTSTACVAMRSKVGGSWAAYIAGVGLYDVDDDALAARVYKHGAKLDEATARAMFPDVEAEYRA